MHGTDITLVGNDPSLHAITKYAIEQADVIEKILKHLGLWLPNRSPPPRANSPPEGIIIDYLDSQIPSVDDYLIDPDYAGESWMN